MENNREQKRSPKICATNKPALVPVQPGIMLLLISVIPVGPPSTSLTLHLRLTLSNLGGNDFAPYTRHWCPDLLIADDTQMDNTQSNVQTIVPKMVH